ncbi:MAG TPA: M43 family zinc metalloprotease [Flavobacteriales bacterium]|nr:M43 family zinc metalloprotease [Flavobacteriales bacterium]
MKQLFTLVLGLCSLLTFAQTSSGEKCLTDKRHAMLYATDPVYKARYDHNKTVLNAAINSGLRSGGVYTIPVVVHVIHLGESIGTGTNISNAQIQSAIDNLNNAYSNVGYAGLDIEVQFALAVRDPNCNATTGINRVNGSGVTAGGDNYSTVGITSNNETAIKALSVWSNSDYYNIWIVSEIDDNGGGSGTQGYAYFPGAGPSVDGAVILYNAFGYDPTNTLGYNLKSYTNYNTTAIHEFGHGFNLYHTFEGDADGASCPTNTSCSTDGDECCDTDAHNRNDDDCTGGTLNTCHGVAGSTVYNNFMAYSSDACQNRFTADQKTRMRAAISTTRASLLTSLALTTAPASPPSVVNASCSPVSSATGLGGGFGGIMSVTYGTMTSSTSNTQGDGSAYGTSGYLDFSEDCLKYLEVNEGDAIPISVTTWFNNHVVKVYVDWNNDGTFNDVSELAATLNISGSAGGGSNTASGSITMPGTVTTGQFLRLRFNADIATPTGNCDGPTHGQVEDYSIYINPAGTPAPSADFSGTPTTVCVGSNVVFTDASTGTTSWSWNFGSGATPASASGVGPHTVSWSTSGSKTIALTATGPGGSDVETKTNYITVNPTLVPSVSIVASSNPITSGTSVTFTATPVNGGTPSYQWKLNGSNVGTSSSTYVNSTLVNGDQISCVMTSTASCASPTTATSNTVTMTVNPSTCTAAPVSGPGGIGNNTDNKLWLDASKITGVLNGTGLYVWPDVSGNATVVSQGSPTKRPIYLTNQLNGLPALDFDGSNDWIGTAAIPALNTDNITWFIIGSAENVAATGHMVCSGYTAGAGSGSTSLWKTCSGTGTIVSATRSSTATFGSGTINHTVSASGYHILSNVWKGTTDQISGYTDGSFKSTSTGVNASPTGHQKFRIGSNTATESQFFNGKISEVIVYSRALNDAERIIVENYLGTKYNLPISANDIYAYESSNSHDAAGIGQISDVNCVSAKGSLVEISNPSSLSNGDFMMWAHDNGSLVAANTDCPSSYGASGQRLPREWRVDKTNDLGTVTVSFYMDGISLGTNFELLVDADGVFTNATRITSGYSYDAGCNMASWTGVSLSDGNYFTIGTPDGSAMMVLAPDGLKVEEAKPTVVAEKVKIYPNPNNGSFIIENIPAGCDVMIYNPLAEIVANISSTSISDGIAQVAIDNANAGIYFVKIINDQKLPVMTERIVIYR